MYTPEYDAMIDAQDELEEALNPYYGEDEEEEDVPETKAERRERRREKNKMGPVRHLDPDLRPATFRRSKNYAR